MSFGRWTRRDKKVNQIAQEDLPTEEDTPETGARFPEKDEHARGQGRTQGQAAQGTPAADRGLGGTAVPAYSPAGWETGR